MLFMQNSSNRSSVIRHLADITGLAALILITAAGCSATAAANRPPAAPTGLLMDLMSEPLGIDNPHPRLSWVVNDPDDHEYQTAYQILVSKCPQELASGRGTVWDSGKVSSCDSSNARYDGNALAPNSVYYWQVRTWDKDDAASPYSEPHRFATGAGNQWAAVPLWGGDADSEPDFLFLRKAFALPDKAIQSAVAHVTALSPEPAAQYVYKLYINGTFVGAGPERGYWKEKVVPARSRPSTQDPDMINRYNTFDVTELLKPAAENVVGALNYTKEDKRFLFQMRVVFEDGSCQMITSNRQWKALDGDEVYCDQGNSGHGSYFYAPREGLDARRYPFGWNKPGYDDTDWTHADEKETIGNLRASAVDNTERHLVLPHNVVDKGNGRYFIDFGRAVVGGIRLDIEGTAGHEVEIRLGEELSATQTVRHNMRTGNTYQEVWTLTDGRQVLENFGYRVFRYAEILNAPDGFDRQHIRAAVLRHPFNDHAAQFASSDPVLNDVWEFCKYSIKATSLDVYVDTHTRERRNYEGDAIINQLSHYAVDREFALPRHSIEYLYYRPTWPTEYKLQSVMMAWYDYLYTGNPDSLQRHYATLKTKTLETFINDDFLVEKAEAEGGQWGPYGRDLVDWPRSQRDGYEFTDINTVINAFNYKTIEYLGHIAEVVGKSEDARRYSRLAENLRRAINDHLYDPETGRFTDGKASEHHALHASAFALALGAVDADKVQPAAAYAASRGMAVSVYGSQFLLEGLYRAGRGQAALSLMNARDGNSWGHMLYNLNATIVCEAWDPPQKPNMSYSHAWASAPANVIPRGMFGIVPLKPAFARFQIKPQPAALDWATLTVPSIRGSIHVAFNNCCDLFNMTVDVPVNTRAKVFVPLKNAASPVVMHNGAVADGRIENGYMALEEVGSGRHQFSSR